MIEEVKIIKAIGCNLRLRILNLLIFYKQGLFVCDMVNILQEQQYNISKHLNILKDAKLVLDKRVGKSVLYKFNFDNKVIRDFIKNLRLDKYDTYKKDKLRADKFSSL